MSTPIIQPASARSRLSPAVVHTQWFNEEVPAHEAQLKSCLRGAYPAVRDSDETACSNEEIERLLSAIESLPGRCREVFVLRKLHCLSQREIAQKLGISEATVEGQIFKANRCCPEFLHERAWSIFDRPVREGQAEAMLEKLEARSSVRRSRLATQVSRRGQAETCNRQTETPMSD